ncbi:MAG: DUF4331 domain-containing protein [Acidobacteriota bacterium]
MKSMALRISLVLLALLITAPLLASSHREAPFLTENPKVDGTDFYMFRSYEPGREGFVTLIANYLPLQDAYGGPNYFTLDPNAHYAIHIDNDGDGIENLSFVFQTRTFIQGIALPIGDATVPIPLIQAGPVTTSAVINRIETFGLNLVRGDRTNPTGVDTAVNLATSGTRFGKPLDNIGAKTFPNYANYASLYVHDMSIPGCGDGRVFVGQRKDPFVVNLGETFDLVNYNPVGAPDSQSDDLAFANVTALALEVPIDCLTQGRGDVIGGWTTASLPRFRQLRNDPTFMMPAFESGDMVQVSRLGMPLVNEVVIGLPDKNLFNAARPDGDAALATYVTNPTLPALLEVLFGVRAPTNLPRTDLVAAFVTGLPGVNELGFGEMQRLNTSIPVTPAAEQNNLGVLGGDNAGFPNGRRPGDDVVDSALRVAMGVLCHALPGAFCEPADAPDGTLPYTDGAYIDSSFFDNSFPYLVTPLAGSPN